MSNYYRDQLKGVLDESSDDSVFSIKVHGDRASSKTLGLNLESIDELRTFLRTIELRLEGNGRVCERSEMKQPRYAVVNSLLPREDEVEALSLTEVNLLIDSQDHLNELKALKVNETHTFQHIDITRVQ